MLGVWKAKSKGLIMSLEHHEKVIVELLAKYSFIEHCKETGIISPEDYAEICKSWGEKPLELIKFYLTRIDEYHKDTRTFIDELKVSGDWA